MAILAIVSAMASLWIVVGIGYYMGCGAHERKSSLFMRVAIVLLWPLAGSSVDMEEGRRKHVDDEDEDEKHHGGPPTVAVA